MASKKSTPELRIGLICPFIEPAFQYGGPVESVRQVCRRLAARGHRVFCVGSDLGIPDELSRNEWVERDGFRSWYAKSRGLSAPAPHYMPAIADGIRACVTEGVQVLHLNLGFTHANLVARRIAGKSGIPYVLTPHGVYGEHHIKRRAWSKKAFSQLFERRMIQDATRVQALVQAEAEAICRYGADRQKICIIPNGVDLQEFLEEKGNGWFHDNCDLPENAKVILFMSRLNASKGLDLLIPGFAQMAPENWYLVIAGPDDGWRTEAETLAAKLGISARVRFPGPLQGEAKYRALADADIFALTSYAEGMPVSVLEACASRTPVLISDRCNLPEIAAANAGEVCPPTIEGVATAVQRMTDSADLAAAGQRARDLVEERYTWDCVISQLEQMYQSVL